MSKDLIEKIVNKQFEMIGINLKMAMLPEDGMLTVGKKKKEWWHVHKFKDETQYRVWRAWARNELVKARVEAIERDLNYIDLRWGMCYKWPPILKEGQLTLNL